MLDRITGMKVFVRAASAGSLSAAARQLEISAAMATKHLNALEARLGVKLFHRTTRQLRLTEAGRDYLSACQRILPEIEEAEALAASRRVEATGTLRMNAPVSFGVHYIAPLMPAFSRKHPAIRLELGFNDRVVDLIEENWDLSIRVGRLADEGLRARKLADCDLVVCAATSYLDRHGVPRRIAELSHHNCLGYSLTALAGTEEWAFGEQAEKRVRISGDLSANNGEALAAAAIGGQGVIYQPSFIVAPAIRRGQLVVLELDEAPASIGAVHAVYPPERRPPAKVRAMVDYLVDAFDQAPPWVR